MLPPERRPRGLRPPQRGGGGPAGGVVQDALAGRRELGAARVSQLEGISENVVFTLPRELAGRK